MLYYIKFKKLENFSGGIIKVEYSGVSKMFKLLDWLISFFTYFLIYGYAIFLIIANFIHGVSCIAAIMRGELTLANVIFQCIISYLLAILVYHAVFESDFHRFKREKRKNYKRFEKKFGSVSIVKDVKTELAKNNYENFIVKVYNDKIEAYGRKWSFSHYDLLNLDETGISDYDLASYFGYCVPFEMDCRVYDLYEHFDYGTGKLSGFSYDSSTGRANANYDNGGYKKIVGCQVIGKNNILKEIPKKSAKQRWG